MNLSYTLPKAEENILSNIKLHTLRSDRKNKWKAGLKIHHSYSFRSNGGYFCFHVNDCKSIQQILIVYHPTLSNSRNLTITVDRKRLTAKTITQLIFNDGFNSREDFIKWFFVNKWVTGRPISTMWAGKIIHWTDLKY